MMKNKKIILIAILVLGVLLVSVGIFLGVGKDRKTNLLNEFTISSKYLVRVRDNLISSDGKKYTYYDLNGKKLLELESENEIFDFEVFKLMNSKDDLFVSTKDGVTYGVIDSSKKEVLPSKYHSVFIVSKNCFIVENENNSYSVVNASGVNLFETNYDRYINYDNAAVALVSGDKWSIIDQNGNLVSKVNYSYVVDYSYDKAKTKAVVLVGQYGDDTSDIYIFKNESLNIIEKVGSSIFVKDKYIYYAVSDGTFSSYDIVSGNVKKNVVVDFSLNGMISTISSDGLLGYKSTDGKIVIKEQYQVEGTTDFTKYGLAVVSLNNLKGVIDKTGKQIIPCKYKTIYVFSGNVFVVSDDDQTYYLIDNNDKKIYDTVLYDGVSDFIVAYNNDKCGIVNRDGKNVTELNNLSCNVYGNMYLVKEKNNHWLVRSN
mgnify:CR=1 FL=1